ncbi:hypothetical protein [Thermococcus sp.]
MTQDFHKGHEELLQGNLLASYFIGPTAEKVVCIGKRRFVLPFRLLALLLFPLTIRTYYVYVDEGITNLFHLALDPVLFLSGVLIIYPSARVFLDFSSDGYLPQLLGTLNSITKGTVMFRFSASRSNFAVVLAGLVLWVLWLLGLRKLNIELTALLFILTVAYMMFWLPVFSLIHYIYTIVKFAHSVLDETNIANLEFKALFQDYLLSRNPIIRFVGFKKRLELIFTPIIRIMLNVLFVIVLAFVAIIILYILSKTYSVPHTEFVGAGYAAVLILVASLLIFGWLIYIIVRLSINLKEILLIELKELKLDPTLTAREVMALDEIDNILSATSVLLIPSRTILEIITAVLTIVGVVLTLLQYVS